MFETTYTDTGTGTGTGTEAGDQPRAAYPGEAAECAHAVAGVLDAVTRLAQVSTHLTDVELTQVAQSLVLVMQQAEASLVAVTSDAIGRGTVDRSTAANATQWVQRLSTGENPHSLLGAATVSMPGPRVVDAPVDEHPRTQRPVTRSGLEPAHAARVAKLADACRCPLNAPLADAVCTGAVNTTIGKTAVEAVDKVKAVLPAASREEILSWFLSLPPGSGVRAVHELTTAIIATYGDDVLDDTEDALRGHESVQWITLPEGMVRLIADLSPEHAEMVKQALNALSAPNPGSDCCDDRTHRHHTAPPASCSAEQPDTGQPDTEQPDTGQPDTGQPGTGSADAAQTGAPKTGGKAGEPDPRSAGKRRADALISLITLGAQAADTTGAIKTFGTARLVVTVDYEVLRGALTGLGFTDTGAGITAETVRQLACDADIIPMVLGSKSQPLDVGRKLRLVDKELRRAVIQRDKHCTFDGCDRPPVMCDVHHVTSWWSGGVTSLLNSALLCGAHHRIVHRDKLTATVTDSGTTWHHARPTAA